MEIKGKGSIEHRGGDTYTVRFNIGSDPNAPGKYLYTPKKTFHAAEDWEIAREVEKYRKELEENGIPDPSLKYLDAYLDHWVKLRAGTHKSPRTADRELSDIKNLKKLFPHVRIERLTPLFIKETYEDNADWLSGGNKYQVNKRLRQILNEAVEDGLLKKNPAQRVVVPKPIPAEKDYLDQERLIAFSELLLSQPISANIAIAELLLHTGMRPAEAYGLSWEDVDFEKSVIHIRHQYSNDKVLRAPKSRASKGDVPLDFALEAYLIAWRAEQEKQLAALGIQRTGKTAVATNDFGSRVDATNYGRWFRNFCVDNGFGRYTNVTKAFVRDGVEHHRGNGYVGLCPNMFRDILPTTLIGVLGVDLETASQLLRHEDATVTAQHYVHPIGRNQHEAADKFARLLLSKNRGAE